LATFGPVERVLGGGGTGPVRRINTLHPDVGDALGEILAISIPDGNVIWRYRSRPTVNTATLTTAGGLVFAGDFDRYFYALDSETGEKLWQTRANTSAQGFPISHAVDGKQYIALPAATSGASWASMLPRDLSPEIKRPRHGNSIYIFALPD
tara:strand:+ start:69 stop:524 length:456 start_codon:yes stop_codon:yes gene_type:complete